MYTLDTLQSGLRVLTAPVDGTESVTVLVFCGAGSRYEKNDERGISHFLEHMFFKGGKKYVNTQQVSAAIEGVGGDFNAFTGKEYAGYYVKVAHPQTELACDVLSDMLLHASFPPDEIDKERGVIIEEKRMYEDTPMYRAGWDFEEMMLGDCPLGWDTIGTEDVINKVTQADFQRHKDELYTPDNTVITFSGRINQERALALAEQYFGALKGKKAKAYLPFEKFHDKRVWLRQKETEQAHLVLGLPGVPSQHPDHFAQKLLGIILGGNMSSRMFLRIREARGMCYYISTDVDSYMDAGIISTRAGIDQSRVGEAVAAIKHEYDVCAKDGVEQDELQRAKDYLKGRITLSLEDSEERANFLGKQALMYPHIRDTQEYFACIDAVTKEHVDGVASRLLRSEELRLVVLGKGGDEAAMKKLLA
jgi:predicted Zn-dependent peptidase